MDDRSHTEALSGFLGSLQPSEHFTQGRAITLRSVHPSWRATPYAADHPGLWCQTAFRPYGLRVMCDDNRRRNTTVPLFLPCEAGPAECRVISSR